MRVALIVPGGVDRSGEYRVIPALLALIRRLAGVCDLQVIALNQEKEAAHWDWEGARIHNVGLQSTRLNAVRLLRRLHALAPFDVIQSIWSGSCGLVAVTSGRLLRVPSAVHIAGGELTALAEISYGGMLTRRGRLRESLVLRGAAAVTAASQPILDQAARLGIRAGRLPLGVDLHGWPPREPVPRAPGRAARLVHVASLNAVKDQSTLLRAVAAVADAGEQFELDIVGEDTLHGEIQELATRVGVAQRTRFHGFMTQRELRPLLERADLMLLTSRHEAGPLVALEAAVAGVPSVGTAVGHLAEWTPTAALAVPVGDWNALATTIRRVLNDEDLRLALAREALQRAVAEDADYTARRFQQLHESLCRHE